jgi:hypothetical protein
MKLAPLIIPIGFGIVGCAAPTVLLVHQTTGQLHECRSTGRYAPTLVGQIVTNQEIESCAKQYEALGYVRATNLSTQQKAALASPQPSTQTSRAKLYPVEGPFVNYGITLEADYVDDGTGHGRARIVYANNLILNGSYSTVDGGESINLVLIGPDSVAAYQTSSGTARGLAAFSGTDGTLLECVYTVSQTSGSGAGVCQDNRGNRYRLLF